MRITLRIEGAGIKVRLCDHWMNPCDEYAGLYSIYDFDLDEKILPKGEWCEVIIKFDANNFAEIYCKEKLLFKVPLKYLPKHGVSYLHMQTKAETHDYQGTLIKRLDFYKK